MLRRLTPDEDATLRRLSHLERLGAELAPPMRVLRDEIRSRDLRREIRLPDHRQVVRPVWA